MTRSAANFAVSSFIEKSARTLREWAGESVNRRILVGAFAAGSAGLFVHIATVGKDLLLAYKFGRGDAVDAFLIAYLVPGLCLSVLSSAFESGIVPLFVRTRETMGHAQARAFYAAAMAWALRFVVSACLLLALSLPWWLPFVAQGFATEKLLLTQAYGYWLLPAIVLGCLVSFGTSLLNAGERFGIAALAPIAVPTVVAIALATLSERWGGMAIVSGTLGGLTVHLCAVTWLLHRRGGLVKPRMALSSAELREGIGQYLPIVFGAALMAMNTFVDQAMAARLEPGSVAALSYARKIPAFVSAALAAALGTAVLPHFARLTSRGDIRQLFHSVNRLCVMAIVLTLPIVLLTMIFSTGLIRLVFERGTFLSADTAIVAPIQMFYAIQIPFYVCATLSVRALSASGLNRKVLQIAIANFVLNLVLTYLFSTWFGARGIALATSIVMIFSAVQIYWSLYRFHRVNAGAAHG